MNQVLGLVLTLTDNATSGINNAVNSLNQLTQVAENASASLDKMASLSATSFIADRIGSSFLSMGKNIISTLTGVVTKVNETGQTLMYARNQLNALYNDDTAGDRVIAQIQDYASKSMFEFENLIPAVTSLKSVGIEAFDSITSSMGNSKNNLLDYASALASFAPQMRNAYGTGINAAIGALREYIAEGNKKSLKSGAGLDITQILGEDKADTIEERTRQVADLIEQLGMLGMVDMMKDSPMVKLSNMGDVLFQFVGKVAESGVYEAISGLIDIFAEFVDSLSDERLQNLAETVSSALVSIIKPVEWIAKKVVTLAEGLFNLVENNPELVRLIVIGSAIVGVLLLLGGIALKITSAFSGLSLMMIATKKSFKGIISTFGSGILKMTGKIVPFLALMSLLRIAWNNDFAGIKTNVTGFVTNLISSFKSAQQAVSGSVEDVKSVLNGTGSVFEKGSFFYNLETGFMRVMTLCEALADVWNDNTLSEDLYLKAQELGILPLIEGILDLKYRFGFFKEGFIEGWKEIWEVIKESFSGLKEKFDGTIFEDIINGLTKFFDKLTDNDPETWKKAGKIFSAITAVLIEAWGMYKLTKGIFKLFGKGKSGGLLGGLLGNTDSASKSGGGFLSNPGKVLKTVGSLAIILGGVALLVLALGALTSVPKFNEFLSSGADTISKIFSVLLPMVATVGVMALALKLLEAIKLEPTTILKGLGDFALIIGGLEVLMLAMGFLNTLSDTDLVSEGADVMNTIAEVLENLFSVKVIGSIGLIGAFGKVVDPATAFNGIVAFAEIVGGIALLVSAFGLLAMIPHFNEFLESGGDTFALLFKQVGKIAGSIISGFGEGLTSSLPAIGENISAFAENLTPFLDMIANAPTASEITDFVKAFVGFLKEMVGEKSRSKKIKDIGESLGDFTSDLDDLTTSMGDFTTISSTFSTTYSDMSVTVVSSSADMITAIENMVTSVSSNLDTLSSTFSSLTLELPNVKVPHFKLNGDFNIETKQVPTVDVEWYAKGGVFNKPSIIGVGENGQEAVMPLENNTGWIGILASEIMKYTDNESNLKPTSSGQTSASNQGDVNNNKYLTSNSSSTTYEGDTDNSVIVHPNAIQVIVQNASEEEATRLAKKILEYIKRQKELDRMTSYAH